MAISADVAARAGVSRSTVSQIFNGHDHRFTPDVVERVRQVAQDLGYRPSLAGRTLALGTSDIVITIIPDITLGARLRELIDDVTSELARAGRTNLLRLASSGNELEDAIAGLRPAGVWSVAPIPQELRTRLEAQNTRVLEAPRELQVAIDKRIGALQAAHLRDCGYDTVVVASSADHREQWFASSREQGALEWCAANGVDVAPTIHVRLEPGTASSVAGLLPGGRVGVAAYNDEVALAVLGAARIAGLDVPQDLGVIGVDYSTTAQVNEPAISSVDIQLGWGAQQIVQALVRGLDSLAGNANGGIEEQLRVVRGATTAPAS